MSLFYFDETIKEYEQRQDFAPIITYLEKRYNAEKELRQLLSLIAYSWYFLVEGGCLLKAKDFDDTLFLSKWSFYLEYGLKEYAQNSEFCYVAGYTLGLHWFYIQSKYPERKGMELMQKCYDIAKNESIKALAKNFLDNAVPNKKYKHLDNAEQICAELFPSISELDKYFKEILQEK